MRPRLELVISIAVLSALLTWGGCGGPDLVVGGALPATPTAAGTTTPTCVEAGGLCTLDGDCCSGLFCDFGPDGVTLECQ